MKRTRRFLVVSGIIMAMIVTGKVGESMASTGTHPPQRSCPEDATWVGMGDYRGGYWSWYKCIAYDDVTAWYLRNR